MTNVGLVMFVSQALQVLVVSLAVGGFFVAFGYNNLVVDMRSGPYASMWTPLPSGWTVIVSAPASAKASRNGSIGEIIR